MLHIIRERATKQQWQEMLEMLETYVKRLVSIAGFWQVGEQAMHADCKAVLLEDGSQPEFIWGADWSPKSQEVTFESLINIRPRQNNSSLELQDPELRAKVEKITQNLFRNEYL